MSQPPATPDWDALATLAGRQAGLFSTMQAADAGYSRALLAHHSRAGKFRHVGRGVYRIAYFPFDDQEELVATWLATRMEGVFSHETALQLHGLSDALPARIHVTVPPVWRRRRLPPLVSPAFEVVPYADRTWIGAVPVTTVQRTIEDCASSGVQREFVLTAIAQALRRGLVTERELKGVRHALAST